MEKSFGMRRLESFPQTVCPQCKAKVRLSPKKIAERIFFFSGLFSEKICSNCGYRWTILRRWWFEWFSGAGTVWRMIAVAGVIAAAAYMAYWIAQNFPDVLDFIKKNLRRP